MAKEKRLPEDAPIFPGGPLASQIASWKKQFAVTDAEGNIIKEGEIYVSKIGNDHFVWRPMTRYEYKQMISLPNTDPLQREEIVCETCVLWPENFNYEAMAKEKAGVPSLLAHQIMEASGFVDEYEPPTML